MSESTETTGLHAASLGQRVGALVYESVLLFGFVFFVGALTHTLLPSADARPGVLRTALFLALGAYFTTCWHKTGQTLAMKAWRIRVVDRSAARLTWARAVARYCAAWTLVLPGVLLVWALSARGLGAMLVFGLALLVMLLPSLFNREHRLLHDWIAGTRLIRIWTR
jgi:uncharacterized RDD family membrane protein YckC